MKHIFLLFSIFFLKASGIIRFSDITSDKGNLILGVEIGANLYVASNDDESLLQKILITNDLETKTALDIVKLGTNQDGTKVAWPATGTISINSTNTEADAGKLTGFLYFTTYTQAQDNNFMVYLVDRPILISNDNEDLTLVFLNLNLNLQNTPLYVPQKSSQVFNFISLPTTLLSIYWNEPMETYKNPNSDYSQQQRIFSNPLQLKIWQNFDNVEPFQIFNDVWYMRSNGRIQFNVQPKWDDPNGSTTSKVTTTGLVMCSYAPENLKINMLSNPANTASAGITVTYNVINPIVFKMDNFEYPINSNNEIRNKRETSYVSLGSTFFSIYSNVSVAGRFAVQYFQIEGVLLPTIATTPTVSMTTPTLPTTTNQYPNGQKLLSIILLFSMFCFFY